MAQEFKISTNPVKLRPLTPRPFTSVSNISIPFCTTNPTPHSTINTLAWNQYLSGVSEYGARREISRVPLVSSRWKPTAEQLHALEEIYRCGTKTPSAQQIQQIAAKLRRFGEIEGKNVFYWFQNHKARERQKKRRQMEESTPPKSTSNGESLQSESRGYLRTEHPNKKRSMPSNCSRPTEYFVPMYGAVVDHCTWTHKITAKKAADRENEKPFSSLHLSRLLPSRDDDFRIPDSGIEERRTLQLFPVRSNDLSRTHS